MIDLTSLDLKKTSAAQLTAKKIIKKHECLKRKRVVLINCSGSSKKKQKQKRKTAEEEEVKFIKQVLDRLKRKKEG